MRQTAGQVNQVFHVIDVFGASRRVEQTWLDAGYEATAFDVKISRTHDICTQKGVKTLLRMALQFLA